MFLFRCLYNLSNKNRILRFVAGIQGCNEENEDAEATAAGTKHKEKNRRKVTTMNTAYLHLCLCANQMF